MRRIALLAAMFAFEFTGLALAQEPAPNLQAQSLSAKEVKLANGWTIRPAGWRVELPAPPLNLLPAKDSKVVHVGMSSLAAHQLALVELATGKTLSKIDVEQSWFGLARLNFFHNESLIWSGGPSGMTHLIWCDGSKLTAFEPSKPEDYEAAEYKGGFRGGIAPHPSLCIYAYVDMAEGKLVSSTHGMGIENYAMHYRAGKAPCDVAWSPDGHSIFVSDWASKCVLVCKLPGTGPTLQEPRATIPVGENPCQIVVHPVDWRVFVACSGSDSISVIDGKTEMVIETISTLLPMKAAPRATPDALCLAPDGKTLYVANADNHCVAVVDIATPGKSQVKGFIPTGFYPTATAVTPDGKFLLVGAAKASDPLPKIDEADQSRPYPYTNTKIEGELDIIPVPDEKTLAEYTAKVLQNCPAPVEKGVK